MIGRGEAFPACPFGEALGQPMTGHDLPKGKALGMWHIYLRPLLRPGARFPLPPPGYHPHDLTTAPGILSQSHREPQTGPYTPPASSPGSVRRWWNTTKLPYALWNMPKNFRLCNISCKNTRFCAIKYLFCCVQPHFAASFARSSFPPKRTTTSCGPLCFSSASDHRTPSPTSCLSAKIARLVN